MCANETTGVPVVPAAVKQYIVQGFMGGCMSQAGYEARSGSFRPIHTAIQPAQLCLYYERFTASALLIAYASMHE